MARVIRKVLTLARLSLRILMARLLKAVILVRECLTDLRLPPPELVPNNLALRHGVNILVRVTAAALLASAGLEPTQPDFLAEHYSLKSS